MQTLQESGRADGSDSSVQVTVFHMKFVLKVLQSKLLKTFLVAVLGSNTVKPAQINRLDTKVSPEAQKPSSEASQDFTENFIKNSELAFAERNN